MSRLYVDLQLECIVLGCKVTRLRSFAALLWEGGASCEISRATPIGGLAHCYNCVGPCVRVTVVQLGVCT